MKLTAFKLKAVVFIAFLAWSMNSFAQEKMRIFVAKSSGIVFQSSVLDIDSITFDNAASNETLILRKSDGSTASEILLNNIKQLTLSDENLSIATLSDSKMYAFTDFAKLLFSHLTTGINNPSAQSGFDVLVSVTPEGKVTVESPAAIKSLSLYGIDGKMISMQHYNSVETQGTASLQNCATGVYLLRVETEQGTIIKKVINLLKK